MSGDSAQSDAQMRVKDACKVAISRADCMMTAGALRTLPKQTQRPGTSTVLYAGSGRPELLFFPGQYLYDPVW